MTRLSIVGGSDAGISAALRARELDPGVEVTVLVADRYPNYSICGIPYFLSDLEDLDLSYTPPLASPWDAIQMAAQGWLRAWEAPLGKHGGG